MVKSVLEYVQSALNTTDSDDVSSIGDTAEAGQFALLLRDVYDELMHRQEWDFLHGAILLSGAADITRPTTVIIPTTVAYVEAIWYNVATDGTVNRKKINWVSPIEFLDKWGNGLAAPNRQLVTVSDGMGAQIQFYVRTDADPTEYTSFDDKHLHFNAWQSTVDSTIVSAKISAMGYKNPEFTIADAFVPFLPEHMVPLLQAEFNAAASLIFKQTASAPDEKRAARQIASARRKQSKTKRDHWYANNFGRRNYPAGGERLLNNALRESN